VTWEAHQAHGFFGFTPDSNGAQPRWHERVDIEAAMAATADVTQAFFAGIAFPESPAFTGGVLDAWPARMVEGLGMARREWRAIQQHLSDEAREVKRG